MESVRFLEDGTCRDIVVRMTCAAAGVWAPDVVDLVDLVAEEYLQQVQDADRVLFPVGSRERPLAYGGADLWTLGAVTLAVVFVGNLLAVYGVERFEDLGTQIEQRVEPLPDPRQLLKISGSWMSGLSARTEERLARVFLDVVQESTRASSQGTGEDARE